MPEYDFRTLSSHDLELLVRDLLQAEMGVTFDSFKPGRDGGIDLRHCSSADQQIIVQVKHYVESGYSPLYRNLQNTELPKVKRLRPSDYIVATSVPLSPENMTAVNALFTPYCSGQVTTYGKEGLNNLLTKHPDIEKKHYKLWLTSSTVLDRILHNDIFNRTAYSIEEITQKMRLYVEHGGFQEALHMLEEKHICIISGQPGIGKTTLAEMLLAKYIADGYEVRVLGDISEAFRADSPDAESRIVFFYDDFLGQASLREVRQANGDSALLSFMGVIRRKSNRRFILTTREYILQEALQKSERLSNAELEISKLVLDLAHYTRESKAHILFNHLYFSDLPKSYKKSLLQGDVLIRIIDHQNYSPRIIDWMTKRIKSSEYEPQEYAAGFLDALQSQIPVWKNAFENNISADSKALLYVLYSLGESVNLTDLKACFNRHIVDGSTLEDSEIQRRFKDAIYYLDGSFISFRKDREQLICSFYNPSIREFVAQRFESEAWLVQKILRNSLYFNQCQSMFEFCRTTSISEHALGQVESELADAILRTLDKYLSINSFSSKERIAVQAMKMAASFQKEKEQEIILHVINWVTGLTQSRVISASESKDLINYAQSRLLDPLIRSLGETILHSPNGSHEFESAISFVENYGDTSLSHIGKEEKFEAFKRFYNHFEIDDLNIAEPEQYISEAGYLSYLGHCFNFDVSDKVQKLRTTADEIYDKYEYGKEAEPVEFDTESIVIENFDAPMSNEDINSLFGTLHSNEDSD